MLRDTLLRIIDTISVARTEPFANHELARFLRSEAAEEIRAALGELAPGMLCEGSPGAGRWADVPWLAVFDPAVTISATEGYYAVYLFAYDRPEVHLSLNQGTTAVRREFGARTPDIPRDRARLIRARIPEYLKLMDVYDLTLGSVARLPLDYESGHAIGRAYALTALPSDETPSVDTQNRP